MIPLLVYLEALWSLEAARLELIAHALHDTYDTYDKETRHG